MVPMSIRSSSSSSSSSRRRRRRRRRRRSRSRNSHNIIVNFLCKVIVINHRGQHGQDIVTLVCWELDHAHQLHSTHARLNVSVTMTVPGLTGPPHRPLRVGFMAHGLLAIPDTSGMVSTTMNSPGTSCAMVTHFD